ncbi:potassium channel family protein [Pseudoalteromonas piratica]|uniref:potassium channel family protein n=1 Tax=Pseudoalteromonas piratica TaxID=1348114 RepID=UPI00068E341E|nr:potassium channel family protein [Pseudoalteromonas piratica]
MSHRDNFRYLTIALTLLLFGTALCHQFFSAKLQHVMQASTMFTLLLSVWGIDSKSPFFKYKMLFPFVIIAMSWFTLFIDNSMGDNVTLALMLVFFLFTAFKTAKQVLFSGIIDSNKILGAICLYFMMGVIWALIYCLIHINFAPAFNNVVVTTKWYALFPEFIYFSFVTLTTLGFGDISPNIPLSRVFVYFEAVVGQLYLTILVASLVGARLNILQQNHVGNNTSAKQKSE